MKMTYIFSALILASFDMAQLYAGDESDDETVVIIPAKQNAPSQYTQVVELFSKKFGPEIASQLMPSRFDQIYELQSSQQSIAPWDLWYLLEEESKILVQYGLRTLSPDLSLKFVYNHFLTVRAIFETAVDKLEKCIITAQKIQFHNAGNLHDVMGVISEIKDLDPRSTAVLWDLHGTLTAVATPRSGETNAKPRNLAPELVKNLAKSEVKNVIVSAWDNMSEVVAQVQNMGLADVFDIPKDYEIEKGVLDINGTKVSYLRVGQVVSVKMNPNDLYYKDKIYALDVLGLLPKTVVLVDDSTDNVLKASAHFANTKASESVDSFHVVYLGGMQQNEPEEFLNGSFIKLNRASQKDE